MTRTPCLLALLALLSCTHAGAPAEAGKPDLPHIILVMADDQGWGQTGYYGHPTLKTPNLDAMAAAGLRFDRFYAGAPVCSPTRASVLTGRANDRSAVFSHGHAMRRQEKSLAGAMRRAGYATGHFGKWHLNGMRGPGVPLLSGDIRHPGRFGFDTWLSVTNFFDRDCIMSRNGTFEEFKGDSSEIIVDEALKFIAAKHGRKPTFTVIWYGTPHSPWMADDGDRAPFENLTEKEQHHYGELVAMDRSIGTLRAGLRRMSIAGNTLVWFCSDNGGLSPFGPATVGGLRGFKGSIFEGGLRVPGIIEWPAGIPKPRITSHPAVTMDIFPTLVDVVGLPETAMLKPIDGISLKPLFAGRIAPRKKPIGFRFGKRAALIDNNYKLLTQNFERENYELYDLVADKKESRDLYDSRPEVANRLTKALKSWLASVDASVAGRDYPGGRLNEPDPAPVFWTQVDGYKGYFEEWKHRPEYRSRLSGGKKKKK